MTHPFDGRRTSIAVVALGGGGCVVAGAALPWLTVYQGLDSFSGTAGLNGRLLVAGGVAVVLAALWYGIRGATPARYAIGGLGFALALFSSYLTAELLATYKELHGIFLPALGPGVFVADAGALLILATLFVGRALPLDSKTIGLASLSAAAGTVHLTVAADHFAEYFLFGLFFVVVGGAQVVWAALLVAKGPSRLLLLLALGNIAVVVLWIVSRTIGVPLGPTPGVPEPVGFADVATSAFELALVCSAAWLLLGTRRSSRVDRLAWALPAAIAPTTVLAVLSAAGAIGFLPATG